MLRFGVIFPIRFLKLNPKYMYLIQIESGKGHTHVFVREGQKTHSIIPPRNIHVPILRTHGRYRKQMKRGYSKLLYNQRNKDETIMSVIGEYVTSRLTRTQNIELSFRRIAYNMHRLTNPVFIVMVST